MKKFWLCLSLCLLSLACAEDSSGRVLTLTITSELDQPEELDRVTVEIAGQKSKEDPEADLKDRPLPRTLTLVHEGGPLGPFAITVYGWLGTQLVVQRDVTASFSATGDVALTIALDREQTDAGCDAGVPDAARDASQDARTLDVDVPDSALVSDDAQVDASPDAAIVDASAPDADAGQPPVVNQPPVCTVTLPVSGDTYQINVPFALRGSCVDPETGPITTALQWVALRDGMLGRGASVDAALKTTGAQRVELCAIDPRDPNVQGCATADIEGSATAQPTVTIGTLQQNGSANTPFGNAAPITFHGAGTGAGVTMSWSDDVQGTLGTGNTATLNAPYVGRHTVSLTGTDRNGVVRTAMRAYVVVAHGETTLVSPLATVNTELDRAGDLRIPMIASDPQSRAYVPSSSGVLYRFDGASLNSAAVVAIGQPPLRDIVQDAQIAADKALAYLATADGMSVCGYVAGTGVVEPCTLVRGNGVTASNDMRSVLRMVDNRNTDTLLIGTNSGLFISESPQGSARGTSILRGRVINDMAPLNGLAALATDNGLQMLTISTQMAVRFSTNEGLPSNTLRSLALGSDNTLWIATSGGLAHYESGTNKITAFTTARGLPNNNTTSVAVQRVTQLSPARDVVWVATGGGVARLDTLTGTITTFTTADGLPTNNVLAVHVLANGIKLFGTNSGLAHYVGL